METVCCDGNSVVLALQGVCGNFDSVISSPVTWTLAASFSLFEPQFTIYKTYLIASLRTVGTQTIRICIYI